MGLIPLLCKYLVFNAFYVYMFMFLSLFNLALVFFCKRKPSHQSGQGLVQVCLHTILFRGSELSWQPPFLGP